MTQQRTADYPMLSEILQLPAFTGCSVCGGTAGLDHRVSGVNLTDTPDYARWLAQGELLITTGFSIADDPQAIRGLLPTAAEQGLSGVGIKPGRYLPNPLPTELAETADRLGLPLLQLPDDVRFTELADAVSREIAWRQIPAEQERQLAVLLHHLVSGAPVDEAIERQTAEVGIRLECPHILLRIRADVPELQRRAWLHEAESRCRTLGADVWGALLEENILLMLEADDLYALEIPLRQMMADFAAEHGSSCGVSRPYGGTAGIRKADHSAHTALRMAEQTGAPCVTDDPAGVVHLLEEASPVETETYIRRQLGTLLRQPEPRRQELLDTLKSWLRCMGNQRQMARELHLHYNTVSYRLQQLWTLLGTDPTDPMNRLALATALYLHRYRRI